MQQTEERLKYWRQKGITAVDTETATFLTVASLIFGVVLEAAETTEGMPTPASTS